MDQKLKIKQIKELKKAFDLDIYPDFSVGQVEFVVQRMPYYDSIGDFVFVSETGLVATSPNGKIMEPDFVL